MKCLTQNTQKTSVCVNNDQFLQNEMKVSGFDNN